DVAEPLSLTDVDCVASSFWTRFQQQAVEAVQAYYSSEGAGHFFTPETAGHDLRNSPATRILDAGASRLALAQPGCPIGKLTACLGAQQLPATDCLQLVSGIEYLQIMASRWPVFALLDREQALSLNKERLHEKPQQHQSESSELAASSTSGVINIPEDCEEIAHPSLVWHPFRRHTYRAVSEAILQLSGEPILPEYNPDGTPKPVVRSLDEAMDFGSGIVWKSASNTMLDGAPVSYWTNLCWFGVAAASALRAFGMLLNENDVFRGVERIFQTQARLLAPDMVFLVLHSRWRLFGLQHALSLLKRARLD
ncbi:unnamed protein product, partial [Amoebophrya sp. A25]